MVCTTALHAKTMCPPKHQALQSNQGGTVRRIFTREKYHTCLGLGVHSMDLINGCICIQGASIPSTHHAPPRDKLLSSTCRRQLVSSGTTPKQSCPETRQVVPRIDSTEVLGPARAWAATARWGCRSSRRSASRAGAAWCFARRARREGGRQGGRAWINSEKHG